MYKIFSLLVFLFGISFQVSAQCGVYFKETNRQVFSQSFANGYFEDFDNDGLEDLLGFSMTQTTSGAPIRVQIQYYKRLSENSFDTVAKTSLIPDASVWFGAFGDVNGDGKRDLIVAHPGILTTYLNDGTGRFLTTTPPVNVSGEYTYAAGDLNNDGKADVVTMISGPGSDSTLYYRLAQPDNSFGDRVVITVVPGFIQLPDFYDDFAGLVLVDDFNNDGSKDLAYVSGSGDNGATLHVLTNNGSLTFTETFSSPFSEPNTKLRTYDINNDGKKDFISNARPWGLRLLVNNGNNTFATSTYVLPITNVYYSYLTKDFFVGDFDNDGDKDMLYPASRSYILLRNDGNLTFVQQEYKSLLAMNAVANMDGDGKTDAVSLIRPLIDGAYRTYDGFNYHYYYLHNAVSFRRNVCNPVGQTKIVDFDGDGLTDRAFWNPATGVWRYYTDRQTGSTAQKTFQWGTGSQGDVPVPNDYDGDGQTDYAVYRKSNGTWWIYRSSDQQTYAQNFGITEDKPVPADYDGDGKADIAVFRPSTGDWHFWLSQTNQYSSVHFGASGDRPLPADYDGDGKADVCVFRPSTGVWYRINSLDNSFFYVQYGISSDKPIPGDYDGDGKANVAVYRDGVWYVLRENSSTFVFNYGIAGDIPFLDDAAAPLAGIYRSTSSAIYFSGAPVGMFSLGYPTGNSSTETFVSSILPPE